MNSVHFPFSSKNEAAGFNLYHNAVKRGLIRKELGGNSKILAKLLGKDLEYIQAQ